MGESEKATLICCSAYVCTHRLLLGCAQTGDWTRNFGALGWLSDHLSHPARADFCIFKKHLHNLLTWTAYLYSLFILKNGWLVFFFLFPGALNVLRISVLRLWCKLWTFSPTCLSFDLFFFSWQGMGFAMQIKKKKSIEFIGVFLWLLGFVSYLIKSSLCQYYFERV